VRWRAARACGVAAAAPRAAGCAPPPCAPARPPAASRARWPSRCRAAAWTPSCGASRR
jgi:hypothetical protein